MYHSYWTWKSAYYTLTNQLFQAKIHSPHPKALIPFSCDPGWGVSTHTVCFGQQRFPALRKKFIGIFDTIASGWRLIYSLCVKLQSRQSVLVIWCARCRGRGSGWQVVGGGEMEVQTPWPCPAPSPGLGHTAAPFWSCTQTQPVSSLYTLCPLELQVFYTLLSC